MRILWNSNAPWSPSGYGQQTNLFTPRIQTLGHQIGILCNWGLEGGIIPYNGMTCYPHGASAAYGMDVWPTYYQIMQANIGITLLDTWVTNPEAWTGAIRWVPWYPVDLDPLPQIVRNKISLAYRRIAMSKFGVAKTHEAGLDCEYIPHGIDVRVFHPGNKIVSRQKLNFPQDRYIVSTVAMNKGFPGRKNFVEMIRAFAAFHALHPNAWYYLHTNPGVAQPDVVNIPEVFASLGLQPIKDYQIADPLNISVGYPADYVAEVYRASDVHMLVSVGEGFGIPTLEAQACGCPVISGGWTASDELCIAGRKISKKDAVMEWSGLASYQFRPFPAAITSALCEEYDHPTDTRDAVEIIRQEYDADFITQTMWKPILAKIQEGLK